MDVALGAGVSGGLGSAGEWLDLMVSEGFSDLSDSVALLTALTDPSSTLRGCSGQL